MTHDTMHVFENLTTIWCSATVLMSTRDGRDFQYSALTDEYELIFDSSTWQMGHELFFGIFFRRDQLLDSSLDVTIALYI